MEDATSGSPGDPRGSPPAWGRERFARPSTELAVALIGARVVREDLSGRTSGVIVETEAYAGPEDRASHARAGWTARTAPMFGPPGHAYVYLVYGIHWCLNVVADVDGIASAVLLRAIAPDAGLTLMRERRGRTAGPDARLAAGPARLCQALAVDRSLDGHDLTAGRDLWIADARPGVQAAPVANTIVAGPRIGVAYAGVDWAGRPWRFGIRDHPSLSRPFPAEP